MSQHLSEGQSFALGTVAALIEAVILQPTLYWKNARAQQLPFTLDPRLLYRGTGASIFNECQMMGFQFCFTAMFQRHAQRFLGEPSELADRAAQQRKADFFSATMGGVLASLFASPVELVMIQQQRFGGSFFATPWAIARKQGLLSRGLMRGLLPTAGRDGLYVLGMLGVTPIVQRALVEERQWSQTQASLAASLVGGVVAAVPSHPLDVVKTCMQGDIERVQFQGFTHTLRRLWAEGGLKRLFCGCMWRTVNITGTVFIANECRNYMTPFFSELRF